MARSCVLRFQLFGIEAVVEAASSRTRWNCVWAWRSGIVGGVIWRRSVITAVMSVSAWRAVTVA